MSVGDLILARRQLASGSGSTTRRNRALPFAPLSVSISARIGAALSQQKTPSLPIVSTRGFVATQPMSATGIRFDPLSISALESRYALANARYSVQPFATSYNVSDSTHWCDTICFAGRKIYINAAQMPGLMIPNAALGAPSIPYLIAGTVPGQKYGDSTLNITEKRVFAVGRYQVQTWGGGGSTQTLQPATPRADGKAVTAGQRLDFSTNKAWLSQIYYTGASWDSAGGGWAFSSAEITMLLAAAYLSKVDATPSITMSSPAFGSATASSGSATTGVTLPSTPVFITGSGEVYTYGIADANGYNNGAKIIWPWSGTVDKPLAGDYYKSYSRSAYSASASASPVLAGQTLTYIASNAKTFDSGTDQYYVKPQTIAIAPGALNVASETLMGSGTMYWYSGHTPGFIAGSKKGIENWSNAYTSLISGSTATKAWEDQTGNFSVKIGTDTLFSVVFSRHKVSGQVATISPNTAYYAYALANPYEDVWDGSGWGLGAHVQLYEDSSTWGNPPAAVHAKMVEMADAFAAMTYYTSELQNGVTSRPYYTASVASGYQADDQVLEWSTKDYLLHDAENGVYISIEGVFSGSQAYGESAATSLTVTLKIQTRHHTYSKTLYVFSHSYSELLPETLTITTGKTAAPSPKVLALFSPLYREQGSFRGASYVTAAEESNGATPFHGFNFQLSLRMYASIATLNSGNESGPGVSFIPWNLVEALYAYVFSQQYGVGATRYPVTSTTRYTDVVNNIFSSAFVIRVRNGAEANWLSGISGALSSDAALTRT